MPVKGSSPLTRGKPVRGGARQPRAGLIPAHAGKTRDAARQSPPPAAHPRSRGENVLAIKRAAFHRGSSPLTRGKRTGGRAACPLRGLIPAHAGKTTACPAARPAGRAHPRSRGENSISGLIVDRATGSSPLTRGKHCARFRAPPVLGLIPAHAGKTSTRSLRSPISRAHPRSRGENYEAHALAIQTGGSSPLTRGKLRISPGTSRPLGLIPAHAGKTTSRQPRS